MACHGKKRNGKEWNGKGMDMNDMERKGKAWH
jgi:hypothetical protein